MRLADRRQAPGDGAGLGHLSQLHQVQRHGLGRPRQGHETPMVGPGAELGQVRAVGPHGRLGLSRIDVSPGLFGQLLETRQGERVGSSGQALFGAVIRFPDARYPPIIARQNQGPVDLRTRPIRLPARGLGSGHRPSNPAPLADVAGPVHQDGERLDRQRSDNTGCGRPSESARWRPADAAHSGHLAAQGAGGG